MHVLHAVLVMAEEKGLLGSLCVAPSSVGRWYGLHSLLRNLHVAACSTKQAARHMVTRECRACRGGWAQGRVSE